MKLEEILIPVVIGAGFAVLVVVVQNEAKRIDSSIKGLPSSLLQVLRGTSVR